MPVPVWKATRTAAGRRLFEWLDRRGILFSRMDEFVHDLDGVARVPALPDDLTIERGSPSSFPLLGRMARPELEPSDRVVAALRGDRVGGVQHVTLDRPFYVEPLDRTLDFDGAYFWGLYVDPAERRRGVASALVATALAAVVEDDEYDCVQTLIGSDNVPSKRALRGVGSSAVGFGRATRWSGTSDARWRQSEPVRTVRRAFSTGENSLSRLYPEQSY